MDWIDSMYIDKIISKLSPSLILCLADRSTLPELFYRLEIPEQTDPWIAYNYRTLVFKRIFAPYKEVHLAVWSLGVWITTRLWAGYRSFTTATTLSGTPFPVHDTLGILTATFEGALHHVSEEGMRRLNRRMYGDREAFNCHSELSPRPPEEIKKELESLYSQILPGKLESVDLWMSTLWDQTILSTKDKIFPAISLRNHWQDRCPIQEIKASHLPFYRYQSWNELWEQSDKNGSAGVSVER